MPVDTDDTRQDDAVEEEKDDAVVDDAIVDPDETDPDAAEKKEDYFLDVDERHRYKTKDEVIKAIKESGTRIGQLSAWEKEVGEAFNGVTPAQAAELLDELIELRKKTKEAAAAPKQDATVKSPADDPASKITDPEERKKHEANLKYLKENGFLTKAEVEQMTKDLREQVLALKGSTEAQESERFNQRVEQGESFIKTLISDAKLPEGVNKLAVKYITGCLSEANDPDGKLFAQFMRGGAVMQTLLKSLFEEFNEGIGAVRTSDKGNYQTEKEKAAAGATKVPPRGGSGSEKPLTRKDDKKKPSTNDRAYEVFQREIRKGGAA